MPMRVLCPGCRKKLAIPDHLTGKVLLCPNPSCKMQFRCPAAPPPQAAPPPAGTTPFGVGPAAPGGGAGGPVQGLGWRLVRRGIQLDYLGLRLGLAAFFLAVAAGGALVISFYLLASNAGQRNAPVIVCWVAAGAFGFLAALLQGIAAVLAGVGQLLCCAVPQGVVSRLCVWGSVAALLVGSLVAAIGGAVATTGPAARPPAAPGAADEPPPGPPSGSGAEAEQQEVVRRALATVLPFLVAAGISLGVTASLWVLGELLWLLFLRQLAWLLGNPRLAGGVLTYVVFVVLWPLLLSCAAGLGGLIIWAANLATPTSLPWVIGVPSALVALLGVISYFWYFVLLGRTAFLLRERVLTS